MDDVRTTDSNSPATVADSDGGPFLVPQEQTMNTQEINGEYGLSANAAYSKASSQESYPERQRHPGGYPSPQEQEPAEVVEDITAPSSAPKNATLPDIPAADDRQCRICLAGSDEEEELGPLIRPCKCKGSIKFVHVRCLTTWRTQSASKSAFWECPQCHFKYAFARTRALGLATSKLAIGSMTIILFISLTFFASGLVSFFLPDVALSKPTNYQQPPTTAGSFIEFHSYDFSYSSIPSVVSDLIRMAVATFADVDISDILPPTRDRDPREKDTILEPTSPGSPKRMAAPRTGGRFKRTVRVKKNGDPADVALTPPGLLARLLKRFMLGLSALGIVSFLQLLISMSLFAPLQIARSTWFRRRRGDGVADGIGTILIVLFVAIGVFRAIMQVYRVTTYLARLILSRAETAILDVDGMAHPTLATEDDGAPLMEKIRRAVMQYVVETAVAWDPRRWREWDWGGARQHVWHLHMD